MSGPFYKKTQYGDTVEGYSAEEAVRSSSSAANHTHLTFARLVGKLHTKGVLTDDDVFDIIGEHNWTRYPGAVELLEDDGMY